MMIEIIGKIIAFIFIIFLLPVTLLLGIYIKIVSEGPMIYWSKRIGLKNKIFFMPKLRTMKADTPQLATHLITNPEEKLIMFGGLIRKYSLDELPQLLSIIKGDLTFIGPRPALFNQYDLIDARTKLGIHLLKPGLTGWAQVNGRDNISVDEKVRLDEYYLLNKSFKMDMVILFKTTLKIFIFKDVSH